MSEQNSVKIELVGKGIDVAESGMAENRQEFAKPNYTDMGIAPGTFGWAINKVKNGERLTRRGWNGKRQYIELATCISYMNSRGNIINVKHADIGSKAIAFVGTSGIQIGWLASQSDMLAEDWEIFV